MGGVGWGWGQASSPGLRALPPPLVLSGAKRPLQLIVPDLPVRMPGPEDRDPRGLLQSAPLRAHPGVRLPVPLRPPACPSSSRALLTSSTLWVTWGSRLLDVGRSVGHRLPSTLLPSAVPLVPKPLCQEAGCSPPDGHTRSPGGARRGCGRCCPALNPGFPAPTSPLPTTVFPQGLGAAQGSCWLLEGWLAGWHPAELSLGGQARAGSTVLTVSLQPT